MTGAMGAPTQSQNNSTPDVNNSLAGKGGAGGGGGVGTVATGSNQPAPFGVPAGLGNPSVGATPASSGGGMGKFGGGGALNDFLNQIGNQPGPMPEQPAPDVSMITGTFPQPTPQPAAGGMMGKGGMGPMPPSMALAPTRQVGAANPAMRPAGGIPMPLPPTAPGPNQLMPTRQVGRALPTMRPAVGAPQPFSPTRQVGRALPGQPSTMPVVPGTDRLPPTARLTPLQPNFRTGGLTRI